MSQEYNTVPKKQKRTRVQRNRPTLVTSTTSTVEDDLSTNDSQSAEPVTTVAEPVASVENVAPTSSGVQLGGQQRSKFLPHFFSKVDKGEQDTPTDETTKESSVIQARMARARKGMNVAEKSNAKPVEAKEEPKAARATSASTTPARAASNRPPSLFKTRHIIGMAIYLLAAQLVLPYERVFAISTGIEKKLADFPFFGFNASITTSFLLNIITLIVLLYLLVRFDLLPSGKKLAASQQGRTGGSTGGAPAEKVAPKVMREGVKGEHDDLYMAYRSNQRRDKKR